MTPLDDRQLSRGLILNKHQDEQDAALCGALTETGFRGLVTVDCCRAEGHLILPASGVMRPSVPTSLGLTWKVF